MFVAFWIALPAVADPQTRAGLLAQLRALDAVQDALLARLRLLAESAWEQAFLAELAWDAGGPDALGAGPTAPATDVSAVMPRGTLGHLQLTSAKRLPATLVRCVVDHAKKIQIRGVVDCRERETRLHTIQY